MKELADHEAQFLSQVLNTVRGQDDLGLRAELLRDVLSSVPEQEVLSLLPETSESLHALASLGQDDLADHLRAWQAAQAARLKHLQVQLTTGQMEIVLEALERVMPQAREHRGDSPNLRGTAVFLLARFYRGEQEIHLDLHHAALPRLPAQS